MYNDKTILALITARGGSKGIPYKNVKHLGEKPLINWTIDEAKKSQYIDRLILSSDDNEIIRIAKNAGCEIPFIRPKKLAEDTSSSMDVILHAINTIQESYDYLLLLQPTSPFRKVDQIDEMIKNTLDLDLDLMISVSEVKKHPAYLYRIINNKLIPFIDTDKQLRRQDMTSTFEYNGSMYLSKTSFIQSKKTYNCAEAVPYVINGSSKLDIDTFEDWEYAEYLIEKGKHL